jgi:hypothetical protein
MGAAFWMFLSSKTSKNKTYRRHYSIYRRPPSLEDAKPSVGGPQHARLRTLPQFLGHGPGTACVVIKKVSKQPRRETLAWVVQTL